MNVTVPERLILKVTHTPPFSIANAIKKKLLLQLILTLVMKSMWDSKIQDAPKE